MFEPSLFQNVMAIGGLPVAMWLTALGVGLFVERIVRVRLANALLLPLGVAGTIVLVYPVYALHGSYVPALVLLVVVTLAGLALADGGLRSRLNPGLPGLAALAAFILFMLPVLVSGHWLWMGYNFDNDTSVQMLLTEHLRSSGTALASQRATSGAVLDNYLSTSYPLGAHAQLATLSGLLSTGPEVLYQGYLSALAALIALAVGAGAAPALGRVRAAVVGFAAAAASLYFQYAMQGNIKEIATGAMMVAAYVLIGEAIRSRRRYGGAALSAIPLAAAFGTYGVAASPYVLAAIGSAVLVVVVFARRLPRPSWTPPAVFGCGLVAALSIPALSGAVTLFNVTSAVVSSHGSAVATSAVSPLGQLARPLPLSQISGVWLSGNYRVPVPGHPAGGLTALATAIILLALIPGVLASLARRDAGPLIAAVTTGLVLAIVVPRVTPYGAGKVFAMASPVVVWVAGVGLCALTWRRVRPLVSLAGLALTAAIVVSDVLGYHIDVPSPTSRMLAIRTTAAHFAKQGPILFNESDEFIKYFAGATDTIAPFDSITPDPAPLADRFDQFFDLDQESLAYAESFPVIVTRRSPIASRPPANFRLVYSNGYYLGWQREKTPRVISHMALQSEWDGSAVADCPAVGALAAGGRRGDELVAAVMPPVVGFNAWLAPNRPPAWSQNGDPFDSVTLTGPGKEFDFVDIARPGVYRAWVQMSAVRPLSVFVDNRPLGSVSGIDSVDQWAPAGTIRLRRGHHLLLIKRGGGTIDPGDASYQAEFGYVMLAKAGPEVLRTVALSHWRSLCGKAADWIELVKP
ncbi:MAG TPA: hypothetical protein VHX66_06800 [Solirubrobacteraceae bacterium]|jgi:hypothetical protein|nr:hypothetical protein [Solirubrobacteraceae bacterium]